MYNKTNSKTNPEIKRKKLFLKRNEIQERKWADNKTKALVFSIH